MSQSFIARFWKVSTTSKLAMRSPTQSYRSFNLINAISSAEGDFWAVIGKQIHLRRSRWPKAVEVESNACIMLI